MKPRTRRTAVLATLLAATAVLTGCSGSSSGGSSDKADKGGKAASGTARAMLGELPVKKAASKDGYDREAKFGRAWSDSTNAPGSGNKCDTRNDILNRDLKDVHFDGASSCVIGSGRLKDPYTGKDIDFQRGRSTSSAVQIDHVIALGNAWVTGAQKLSQSDREALANDPLNLIAADGPANGQKSDRDASQWLPGNKSFQCPYVARQIAVKKKYKLWVTAEEKDAMGRVLDSCPNEKLPTDTSTEVTLKSQR
ncbi:HNH endonuclease family protein [Streptomyces gamaensis]|uniref:HNH endonuclease family protein n=1 Tax=Streptomyces gamaensis TaxID=1763542 RepID=A0ABW0YZ53_9ACTN